MDLSAIQGADLKVHLPIGEALLNQAAGNMMQHPELDRLELTCLDKNRMNIRFTVSPGITISRELRVYVHPDLGLPGLPRLHLTIERGLKIIDRVLIGFIRSRLPDWVQLQSRELFIELLPLFAQFDLHDQLTKVRAAKVHVQAGKVLIDAKIKT